MKQYDYRSPNTACLQCASPRPQRVTTSTTHDYTSFNCPDCNNLLLKRIATADGGAHYPSGLFLPPEMQLRAESCLSEDVTGGMVALYWTGRAWSICINGVHVEGSEKLTEFAKHLESL